MLLLSSILPAHAEAQLEEVHPVIIYRAVEVDAIRSRLDGEPYAGWLNRIQTIADDAIDLDISWSGSSPQKEIQAYYAKMMAAAYVFSPADDPRRESWADEAAEALYGIPSGNYNQENRFNSDLEVSQAAAEWAAAYDMLAGAGYDFVVNGDSLEVEIRNKLDSLRQYIARSLEESLLGQGPSIGRDWTSCSWPSWMSVSRTDNHHVKRYAALTVLSIAIYGRGGSPSDLSLARLRLADSLNNLIVNGADSESVWAEGPLYHLYSMNEYIPAMIAMKNFAYYDFYQIADLAQAHLSLPRMAMPDSYLPPFDDNEASIPYMAGLLHSQYTSLPGRDSLNWLWESAGRPMNTIFLPEYLARYDNSPSITDPGEMGWDEFGTYPESGFARFRSSWNSDAVYLLLQSEHGEARYSGQAHEHPDPGAFMLHAYGDLLLTDSGYGGWVNHDQTRNAVNHNIILVNGKGPLSASKSTYWNANGVDAYITSSYSTPALDYAVSETLYENTAFSRHVMFPGRRYFLLYDDITGSENNTYTMLLHGYGGGNTGGAFTMENSGARWVRDHAGVKSFSVGTGALAFTSQEYPHAVYGRTMGSHTALKIDQQGADAGYLTLLYPYPIGGELPAVTQITGNNATGISIAWGDSADYGVMTTGGSSGEFTVGNHAMTTDADMVWLGERDGGFSDITLLNGSSLMDGSRALISASDTGGASAISISMSYIGNEAVEGYVRAGFDTRVTIPVPDSVSVTINGEPAYHETSGGFTTFWVTGEGYWCMERSGIVTLDPPENFIAADVPNDNGHQMDLFWSPSPSEAAGLVSYYRIYRSRSPEFGEVRAVDSFGNLDTLIAWEETRTVLVDSVAAGVITYRDSGVPLNGRYYYFLEAVGSLGVSEKIVSGAGATGIADVEPIQTTLAASPNPFNAAVTISYELPSPGEVRLRVYTAAGQEAAVIDEGFRSAGAHAVVWNAEEMPSGMYFCLLETGDVRLSRKMLLLK